MEALRLKVRPFTYFGAQCDEVVLNFHRLTIDIFAVKKQQVPTRKKAHRHIWFQLTLTFCIKSVTKTRYGVVYKRDVLILV